MTDMRLGLSYSDVLIVPKRTPLRSRSEASLETKFTKNITLHSPLVCANMATACDHVMAIALASQGGLAVLHQFCTIEQQAEEVRKVKKVAGYLVDNPVTIHPQALLEEALDVMDQERTRSLVVMQDDTAVGLLTRGDYKFMLDTKVSVKELMTPLDQVITAPYSTSLTEAKALLHKHRKSQIILVDDETKKLRGLITAKDIFRFENQPYAVRDSRGRLLVAAAVGVNDGIERARALVEAGTDVLVLDAAHGHSEHVLECLRQLKKEHNIDVMAGNIVTKQAAKEFIEAGADGLKVGVGPSPVCSTRIVSGAGVPQFTAVCDVAEIAKQYDIPVCADGGVGNTGNAVKALAAGAHTVMGGKWFAATDESPGRIIVKDGKRYKRYAGSASYDMNHERKERVDGKRHTQKINVHVEGVATLVDHVGPVRNVIESLHKGIQSGLSYCGARTIQEAQDNTEFIQITQAGWQESNTRGQRLSE